MSKLFKLKEFLTLDEAAVHISNVLGEPATEADLYRFAIDHHLTLSVNFVNHANARVGRWVTLDEIEFCFIEYDILTGEKLEFPYPYAKNYEVRATEDDWIRLESAIESIEGIWDLSMLGAEKLDVEHYYQQLTSGLEVTLASLDGVFVQKDDVVCQLQTDFDDNEYQRGSKAHGKELERHIITNGIGKDEAENSRAKFKIARDDYLKKREKALNESNYFPSGGLDEHDFTLVVRTKEITRFIQSLEDAPVTEKPLASKERNSLLVLIGALCKEVKIDPSKRGVASSLVAMTEILGAPLTDDTIRKILNQIESAVSAKSK